MKQLKKILKNGCCKSFMSVIEKVFKIYHFPKNERIKRLIFLCLCILVLGYFSFELLLTAYNEIFNSESTNRQPIYEKILEYVILTFVIISLLSILILHLKFQSKNMFVWYVYFFNSFVSFYFVFWFVITASTKSILTTVPTRLMVLMVIFGFNFGDQFTGKVFLIVAVGVSVSAFVKDMMVFKLDHLHEYYYNQYRLSMGILYTYFYDLILFSTFYVVYWYYVNNNRKQKELINKLNWCVNILDFHPLDDLLKKEKRLLSDFENCIVRIVSLVIEYRKALPTLLIYRKQKRGSDSVSNYATVDSEIIQNLNNSEYFQYPYGTYSKSDKSSKSGSSKGEESSRSDKSFSSISNNDDYSVTTSVIDSSTCSQSVNTALSSLTVCEGDLVGRKGVVGLFCSLDINISQDTEIKDSGVIKDFMDLVCSCVRKQKGVFHGFMFNLFSFSTFNCLHFTEDPERTAFYVAHELSETFSRMKLPVSFTIFGTNNLTKIAMIKGIYNNKFVIHSEIFYDFVKVRMMTEKVKVFFGGKNERYRIIVDKRVLNEIKFEVTNFNLLNINKEEFFFVLPNSVYNEMKGKNSKERVLQEVIENCRNFKKNEIAYDKVLGIGQLQRKVYYENLKEKEKENLFPFFSKDILAFKKIIEEYEITEV